MLMGPLSADVFRQMAEQASEAPPELRSLLEQFGSGQVGAAAILVSLVFSLIFFSVFGLLGGLLGQALFKKTAPPAPPLPAFLDPMR
jgi:hypothetical protein